MSALTRIRWKWVLAAGFLSEASVMVIFFFLLAAATLAGVPSIASPMSPLDYVDALVSSFVMAFVFTLWVGKRVGSDLVLHGALIGVVGALLFTALWTATTPTPVQPALYVVAHGLKIVGGICGGIVAKKRKERLPSAV